MTNSNLILGRAGFGMCRWHECLRCFCGFVSDQSGSILGHGGGGQDRVLWTAHRRSEDCQSRIFPPYLSFAN